MAFSNAYSTTTPGSAVGNREDLSETTYVVEALEAPFKSLIAKETANNTLYSWTVDSYRAPRNEGIPEGKDVDSYTNQFANLSRLFNVTQHFRDDFGVSREQQAIEGVTPVNIANAEAKAEAQVHRDMEFTFLSSAAGVEETGANGGRKTRGLGYFVNAAPNADDLTAIPAAYRTPAGSIHDTGDWSESAAFDVLESMWTQSGKAMDYHMIATTTLRQAMIENFTRVDSTATAVRYPNPNKAEVTYDVELFYTPIGSIKVLNANPECLVASTQGTDVFGYIFDPEMVCEKVLIPMGSELNEDQGGGPRGFVDCVSGLCVKNPLAFGKVLRTIAAQGG